MNKPFDMELFLSGVLTGSKVTQQRHQRQARIMQAAIQKRWQRDNPWRWQHKHIRWFLTHHLKDHSYRTQYCYKLAALLIWRRVNGSVDTSNLRRERSTKQPNDVMRAKQHRRTIHSK